MQTADERLIEGTAFISDVGMCGVYDSIIGRDIDEAMARLVDGEITRFTVAKGAAVFCGVIIRIDENTNQAVEIQRIQLRP